MVSAADEDEARGVVAPVVGPQHVPAPRPPAEAADVAEVGPEGAEDVRTARPAPPVPSVPPTPPVPPNPPTPPAPSVTPSDAEWTADRSIEIEIDGRLAREWRRERVAVDLEATAGAVSWALRLVLIAVIGVVVWLVLLT